MRLRRFPVLPGRKRKPMVPWCAPDRHPKDVVVKNCLGWTGQDKETLTMWGRRAKTKSIAVVTALNPRNAGMYSVDLAAEQFLGGLGFETILLRGQTPKARRRDRFGIQQFQRLDDPEMLLRTSALVYWGDFTTSPLFAFNDFARRDIDQGAAANPDQAFERWCRLFLLHGSDRKNTKVASVGQNFLSLGSELSRLNLGQRRRLEDCYRLNFDFLFPRDPISTEEIRSVTSGANLTVEEGMDAAFLLQQDILFPELADRKQDDSFTYVFGRSGLNAQALVKRTEAMTGLRPVELKGWLDLDPAAAHRQYGEMLGRIASSRFLLTDVYHCSINALSMGKPVLGLGVGSQSQSTTLSDLKKAILFRSLQMEGHYVDYARPAFDDHCAQKRFSDALDFCLTDFSLRAQNIANRKLSFRQRLETALRQTFK